jgi:hypothetical protein
MAGQSIVKMEIVDRRFFGKPVTSIKVYWGATKLARSQTNRSVEGLLITRR